MTAGLSLAQADLAREFRVSTRTIQRWHEEGLPRESEGTYCLADVIAWAIERERERATPSTEDYDQALTRKTLAQAELAEIQVATQRRLLVPVDEVEAQIFEPLEQVDAALRNAPARHAHSLAEAAKITVAAAQKLLYDAIEEVRGVLRTLDDAGGRTD